MPRNGFWNMLNQIKKNLSVNNAELLKLLSEGREKPVHEPTLYYWENKDIWPSWALKKCGILK